MLAIVFSLLSGIGFAIGLVISGMTNPKKVIGFLDIFGAWDYSLAFVMVGAIGTSFFLFRYFVKRNPVCGGEHFLPTKTEVDKKLITGSAMFGIGWGLTGICPGPGIVNLVTRNSNALIFVGSMIVGMIIYQIAEKSGVIK